MKRYIILLVLLTSCALDDSLKRICGNVGSNQCWAVPGVSPGVTEENQKEYMAIYESWQDSPDITSIMACKIGEPVCDEDSNILECNGEVLSSDEICDDLDNDCNGYIDDLSPITQQSASSNGELFPCYIYGECRNAQAFCDLGVWNCRYPYGVVEYLTYDFSREYGVPVNDESWCDGLDNDCDGRIDEDLFEGEFCFEVPLEDWWKGSNGECRVGVKQCVMGAEECVGQILPVQERCDGLDNDCNGIIDDTGGDLSLKYDIVFNIDRSGSMGGEIQAVICMVDTFSAQYEDNDNYRFALVDMTSNQLTPQGRVDVLVNFTDFATFRSVLLSIGATGYGLEASLDAMYFVADKTTNPLQLDWRVNAKALSLLFSDEFPQSLVSPQITAIDVIDMSTSHNVIQYIWSKSYLSFEPIAIGTGGMHFNLSSDCQNMVDDANVINTILCISP